MLKSIRDRNIILVYGATVLLATAYGTALGVLSVFLDERGYSKPEIGELAVAFALGITIFALPMGTVIKHLSARTTLVLSLLGYAAAITLFPYVAHEFWLIALVRFVDGACSVGIWVSSETILLSRAETGQKAHVTSLYAISVGIGYLIGFALAPALMYLPALELVFVVSGVLSTVSGLSVWLRLAPDVKHEDDDGAVLSRTNLTAAQLLWRIKTSCFGTFAYGYFQSSIVLFMPLYLIEVKGIPESTVALFLFFALGMLALANPAARLGDRYGHLLLMRFLALVGCGVVGSFIYVDTYWVMMISVTMAGATLASISPISLALQGVIVDPPDYSRSNSIYNVFYAAGMLVGPYISSRIYHGYSGITMMLHLAGLWAAFVVFTTIFANDDPARVARKAKAAAST